MDDVFDEEELLRTVQGDHELVKELGNLFLGDVPSQVAAIREGIERDDAQAVRFAAHTVKGSASAITARRIAQQALELEEMGAAGNLAGASDRLRAMEAAISELQKRIG
jgi:two-component system, sensor histidine kinase and response regulator